MNILSEGLSTQEKWQTTPRRSRCQVENHCFKITAVTL